ncbi:MAG: RNA degradosome polyphosphate kinase, partial [Chloroflexi bacterium]|nr:RNA degradosome polyphosphate kinase [Chloroflexota bacterium]
MAEAEGSAPDARLGWDLESPELYLNRELTWLSFNERVLHEAEDARNPLLERVKFLAITAANLDEFFMKRIGGLKQQVVAGLQELTVDGRTPQEQIDECEALIYQMEARQHTCLAELLELLRAENIRLIDYTDLTEEQRAHIRAYYLRNVHPLVT